jgi:hypothetical protein
MFAIVESQHNLAKGVWLRPTLEMAIDQAVALSEENDLDAAQVRQRLTAHSYVEDGDYCLSICQVSVH